MNKEEMNTLIKKLSHEKILINWNKKPIKMDLFISFLTVETDISRDHLGSTNGWTQRVNKAHNLIISGGILNGVNYLNSLQFGTKLMNPYNNYVNPFFLFPIMNDEGKKFFIEYYNEEIKSLIETQKNRIESFEKTVEKEKIILKDWVKELENLNPLN